MYHVLSCFDLIGAIAEGCMRHATRGIICSLFFFCISFGQIPSGGVVRDLTFFWEEMNDSILYRPWSSLLPVPSAPAIVGQRSLKFVVKSHWAGFHVFWGGPPNTGWWGADTSVFWAQSNSELRFWVRSTVGGMQIQINAYAYERLIGPVGTVSVPAANRWQLCVLPIPASVDSLPLKGFEFSFGPVRPIVYFDDFKITSVRMYAGNGNPGPPTDFNVAMDYIAASQVGYAPQMPKQFTSPVNFSSYEILRASDSVVVFRGGGPIRSVTSNLIGGATAYVGDFSSFTAPGRFYISAGGKRSLPFNVNVNVFDEPVRLAQRFFYYQRAFTAITMPYAEGPWVHPSDSMKAPAGIRKGWHDAGDLTVYFPTMAQTIWWLLESWMDFQPFNDSTNIPESGNGIPDVLDEARWGLEWVLSMQDSSGGFWGNTCAEGGNGYYYGTSTPNTINYYLRSVPPRVQNTAKATAVLAYASKVFAPFDSVFAAQCLSAAQAGWSWIMLNPTQTNDTDYGNCNVYSQGSDPSLIQSNKQWAAAALLYATGNAYYDTLFHSLYQPIVWISSYSKSDGFAGKLYLRCTTNARPATQQIIQQSIYNLADFIRSDAASHPFQWATHYYWGSMSNAAHRTGQFSWMAYVFDSTRTADRDQLLHNMHYMFGRNYLNYAFMSGADAFGATRWRREGFHHWMKALQANPFHFPGAIAGGPNDAPPLWDASYINAVPYPIYGYFGDPRNPRDASTVIEGRFTDNDSWSTNEVTINWQAAVLYNLLAAQRLARSSFGFAPDTVPPVISGEQVGAVRANSALMTWNTNEPSASLVEFGLMSNFGTSYRENTLVTQHGIELADLLPDTLYYVRVRSIDTSGNLSSSPTHTFRTGKKIAYAPTSTTILEGTLVSGTNVNLALDDSSYYIVNAATAASGTSDLPGTADWYASVAIAESSASVVRLTITYDGSNSQAATPQALYVYDWVASAWTMIDSQAVGTTDLTIVTPIAAIPQCISTTGEIRVRVRSTGVAPCSSSGDFLQFSIETAGSQLTKYFARNEIAMAPEKFKLYQNYPNPFNPTTIIKFEIAEPAQVSLRVYDILGREVATIVNEPRRAGVHTEQFDARNLSTGIYFYRLTAGSHTATKRMALIR